MALRAGYHGIKGALVGVTKAAAEKLAGLPAIKTIGDGLTLSDEGVLSSDSTGGIDYKTTEQDTGLKWIDGRSIYQKTWSKDSIDNIPAGGKLWITTDYSDIDLILTATTAGAALSESGASCEGGAAPTASLGSSGVTLYASPSVDAKHVTLTYVKTATNTKKKRGGAK